MQISINFVHPRTPHLQMAFFREDLKNPPGTCVIHINPSKLDDDLKKNFHNYVGEGSLETKQFKVLRIQKMINDNENIEMPMIFSFNYSNINEIRAGIQVSDGRHRLFVLRTLGITPIPVVVPAAQSRLLEAIYS